MSKRPWTLFGTGRVARLLAPLCNATLGMLAVAELAVQDAASLTIQTIPRLLAGLDRENLRRESAQVILNDYFDRPGSKEWHTSGVRIASALAQRDQNEPRVMTYSPQRRSINDLF